LHGHHFKRLGLPVEDPMGAGVAAAFQIFKLGLRHWCKSSQLSILEAVECDPARLLKLLPKVLVTVVLDNTTSGGTGLSYILYGDLVVSS
jgi:hypothetical protein